MVQAQLSYVLALTMNNKCLLRTWPGEEILLKPSQPDTAGIPPLILKRFLSSDNSYQCTKQPSWAPGASWDLCIYVTAIKLGATNAFCIMISADCACSTFLRAFIFTQLVSLTKNNRSDDLYLDIFLCIILLCCEMESKQQEETTGKSKQEPRRMIMWLISFHAGQRCVPCCHQWHYSGQVSLHQGEEWIKL